MFEYKIHNKPYYENLEKQLIEKVRKWFANKDPKSVAILGVSGGKDSTVCLALLVRALGPKRIIPVLIPNDFQADIDDSHDICWEVAAIEKPWVVNIGPMYEYLCNFIVQKSKAVSLSPVLETNTPARLRMTTLYAVAAQMGGYVCNTGNKSEAYVGYCTKWGDAVGDFAIIGDLTCTEVTELGVAMGIPERFMLKKPSDGMSGKTDEEKLGFTYAQLDEYLINGKANVPADVVERIERMHNNPNPKTKLVHFYDE